MKFNFKGIRFSIWFYFSIFSLVILLLLGFLQVVLIKPYYRNNRIMAIETIKTEIQNNFINDVADQTKVDDLFEMVLNNNVCAVIYNENAKEIYKSDSLGANCLLNQEIDLNGQVFEMDKHPYVAMDILKREGNLEEFVTSPISGLDMLLYGQLIRGDLANYYLFINSPLEPVESVIQFILRQYLFISIIVLIIAFIISYLVANRISSPIITMKKAANHLASGHYDVDFSEGDSFSEINDLAHTLNNATDELSKLNELRKDLIANVSHDIKTPLTMIQAYAEMIDDISGDDPLKRKEHLDVILKETKYLNRLVSDMQELSKVQAGYIELNKHNFDLHFCIEEVLELLDELFIEHHLTIKKDLMEVVVYADEMKISQVVYNYVSNAIKHSRNGSTITIKMQNDEEKVRVEVIDEGSGIKEEDLPYIWDRYYKIDKGFSRTMNSSGLGLAIVKAILEAHGAKYGVESKVGKGSKFYFELSKDYETDE